MGPPSPSPRLLRVALPCTSDAEVLWATTVLKEDSVALTGSCYKFVPLLYM
jgi:hypothetical protein